MLVNILFYSLAASLSGACGKAWGHGWEVAVSLGALFLVIIFGEVTPKNLAVLAPRGFLTVAGLPMYLLHRLLGGVRRVLGRITRLLQHLCRPGGDQAEGRFEELRLMLDNAAERGELTRVESALVSEVIDLAVVKVREFMTPRVDLVMVEEQGSVGALLQLARDTGTTKIPVYRQVRDDIIGMVDARDLYLTGATGSLRPHIQPPVYVTEYQRASATLRFLQGKHTDLAIVVDEYGGTAGIVTLSDVLEEVFGTPPADDAEAPPIRKVNERQYLLAGDVSLRELRSLMGTDAAPAAVDTVGGLVAYLLGRVPRPFDSVTLGPVVMTVEKVVRRRVARLRLEVVPLTPGPGEAAS
jgi:CBS domain containing-hemolysin-like protein